MLRNAMKYEMRDWLEQRSLNKGVFVEDYVSFDKYLEQLTFIQATVTDTLIERDHQFDGDDGIEGILIGGSYAQSHPAFEERMWVHSKRGKIDSSDLDIALLTTHDVAYDKEAFFRILDDAYDSTHELQAIHDALLLHPVQGFRLTLQEKLQQSLDVTVDIIEILEFGKPAQDVIAKLENRLLIDKDVKQNLLTGGGLLILTPYSQYESIIISTLQMGKLPIVYNPTTNKQMLSYRE